jgi:hypothetical protein
MDKTNADDDQNFTVSDSEQALQNVNVASTESAVEPTAPKPQGNATRKRMIVSVAVLAAIIVVGASSFAVGHSGKAALRASLAQTRDQLSALQSKYDTVQGQLGAAQYNFQQAQTTAQQAAATAGAKAKEQYAAKVSSVDQEQSNLNGEAQQLKTELGQLQASSISGSGVYVVGQDIKSGTWHTNGDGGMTDNECYYATLSGSDTISDIIDNNNFDGDETVDVSGAYALEISGPCTWYLAG